MIRNFQRDCPKPLHHMVDVSLACLKDQILSFCVLKVQENISNPVSWCFSASTATPPPPTPRNGCNPSLGKLYYAFGSAISNLVNRQSNILWSLHISATRPLFCLTENDDENIHIPVFFFKSGVLICFANLCLTIKCEVDRQHILYLVGLW